MTKNTKSLIAILLSIFVICSILAIPAFAETDADGETTAAEESSSSEENTTDEEVTTAPEESSSEENTTEEGSTTAESESESGTKKEEESTAPAGTTNQKKGMSKELIVNLIIVAVIVFAGVVVCIVFRAKLIPFMLAVKSDLKKISWQSWKDTRKNTLVVLAVVVALGILIFLLDYAFSEGVKMLAGLFS